MPVAVAGLNALVALASLALQAAICTAALRSTGDTISCKQRQQLACTRQIGCNTWNEAHCHVSYTLEHGIAPSVVSSEMKQVGY